MRAIEAQLYPAGALQLQVLILSSAAEPATKLTFSSSASSGTFTERGMSNLMTGQLTSLLERA